MLNSIKRARGAGYNHRNRRGCLNGTREALLDKIEQWTEDENQPPIFWLSGLAGTGKSTIAQTVAERCFANGTLGASFFCSGDASLKNHSDPRLISPTLAFQLAHKYPDFRSSLVPHLRSNPDVAYESLKSQVEKLLVGPLRSTLQRSSLLTVWMNAGTRSHNPSSSRCWRPSFPRLPKLSSSSPAGRSLTSGIASVP